MAKKRSGFQHFLQAITAEGQTHLQKHAWALADPAVPDVETIQEILLPYLGRQENPPPQAAKTAAALGPDMGTALEAQGDLIGALAWYRLGRYVWRGGEQFESNPAGFPHFGSRMTAGRLQMEAAICADRVSDSKAAHQLFSWAVKNRSFSEEELREFELTKQPYAVWKWTIQRAYALLCLGKIPLAHEAANEALQWIEKDKEADLSCAAEMPLLILPTVLALIRYEIDPSQENRSAAVQQLDLDAVTTRSHPDHLAGLFYLFNLRAKYPELAMPEDNNLPPGSRAKQAAEACQIWISKIGLQLDGSVESLKLLDDQIRKIYKNFSDQEQEKLVLFMLGCYFGEVVSAELAGGKWNFSAETMLSWTLDWQLGDVELQLWPFQRVYEYAIAQNAETLTDLWEQTQQAYIHFGLTSHFKE